MGVTIRKKAGKWYVFVNYHGHRKAKCIGASRSAAEQVKRALEARLALGDLGFIAEQDAVPTFADYSDKWVRQYAEIACKPSTVVGYRGVLRLYLLPKFGTSKLNAITRPQVKEFAADWSAKLSRSTVRHMLCALRMILAHAMEDGIIDRNPADRLGRFNKGEIGEKRGTALPREEVARLLDAVQELSPEHYPIFLTAVRAGLRRGELIALKWGDIQFGTGEKDPNRYILVQRNHVLGQFTSPKSKRSRRVDLSCQLRRVLVELRDQKLLEAFLGGRGSITDDLVFRHSPEPCKTLTTSRSAIFCLHCRRPACGASDSTISGTHSAVF